MNPSRIRTWSFVADALILLPGAGWFLVQGIIGDMRESTLLTVLGISLLLHVGLKIWGHFRRQKAILLLNQGLAMLLLVVLMLGLLTILPEAEAIPLLGTLAILTAIGVNIWLLQHDWKAIKGL